MSEATEVVNSALSQLILQVVLPVMLVGGAGVLLTEFLHRRTGDGGRLLGAVVTGIALIVTMRVVLV